MRSMTDDDGTRVAAEERRPRRAHGTPLPSARGPISRALLTLLTGPPTRDAGILANSHVTDLWRPGDDVPWWEAGEDAAVALVHLTELERRGLEGVDAGWEGHPLLATVRWTLSTPIDRGLELLVRRLEPAPRASGCRIARLVIATATEGAQHPQGLPAGFRDTFEEDVVVTAIHRLRDRDAHAALLPTLAGPSRQLLARAAIGDVDSDEDAPREAVAAVLRGLGLPDRTGQHLDTLSGAALWRLAVLDRLVARRSSRAIALGWLAAADALAAAGRVVTGDALRTRGVDAAIAQAWDACVIGHLATLEATERFVDAEPALAADVLLGAQACVTATDAVERATTTKTPTPMEGLT